MTGVIVAAGYGSRFLPLTKTMPKEMLPLFVKPSLDFILDEFEEAGIRKVVMITSRRKKILEDYLDREVELESVLERDGKNKLLDSIRPRKMEFIFIRQQEMKGTGQALLLTKPIVGAEPFIVAYPDDIVLGSPGLSTQMIRLFEKTGKNILSVRIEKENLSRYGVIRPHIGNGMTLVDGIVEKPAPGTEPSNMVSIGRYLFTPEILNLLEEGWKSHTKGEFYHIDAINRLSSEGKVIAHPVEGTMLDTGEPLSYLESFLIYSATVPEGKKVLDRFFEDRYRK
jgi:UTP--glucose-1-phosphate uridylyltransferase